MGGLFGAKPLLEPLLTGFQLDPLESNFSEILVDIQTISFTQMD